MASVTVRMPLVVLAALAAVNKTTKEHSDRLSKITEISSDNLRWVLPRMDSAWAWALVLG